MAKKSQRRTSEGPTPVLLVTLSLILLVFPLVFYSRAVTRAFDLTKSAVFTWLWLVLGSWILFLSLWKDQKWLKTPLLIPIIGYALSLVFSTIFSITPVISFLGVYERQIGLIVQLQAISLAFILAGVVDRKNLLNIVVDTLIVFGTVNALVGISQFFGFDPLGFTSGYGTEAFGFMGNPDFFGPVMVITTFLTFGRLLSDLGSDNTWIWLTSFALQFFSLMVTAQGGVMGAFGGLTMGFLTFHTFFTGDDKKKNEKWLYAALGVALALFVLTLLVFPANRMTDLLSAVLGIGVGLTLWAFINLVFLDRRDHAKLWRFSAILVVVVLAVGIFGVYEIYSLPPVTIAEKLGSTVGTRLVLWKHTIGFSIENTLDGKLFGIGIESFRRGFMPYKPLELSQLEPNVNYDDPHNNFLGVLAKAGIIGFVFYAWIFIAAAGMLYKTLKMAEPKKEKMLIIGIAAALVAYATNLVTIFDMLPSLMMFYALLGLIMASYNIYVRPTEEIKQTKPWVKPTTLVAWALLLGLSLYNGYYYFNAWKAESYFRSGLGNMRYYESNQASLTDEQKPQVIASSLYFLDKAMAYNPNESYYAINYLRAASYYWDLTQTASPDEANNVVATAIAKAQQYESTTWAPENLYATMANVYAKVGGLDKSIEYFEKAVNWDHQFYSARMNLAILLSNRAQLYLAQGNKDAARTDLNTALEHIKHAQEVLAITTNEELVKMRDQMASIQKSIESLLASIE
ncbi:MAG: O-antigen ligase family protein [Coprothermobacter proteolyticus]|uniref:O-antigen ligase family protein n=1 Tax=Coprothermobacter proteolyticus TaxID=35786 RepID=UPI000D303C66|nr:O-antigen ligase family protein [Coprothermobacter proteolyticus]MBP8983260.1 O-antigen ligase family protein [Coprothermobacter sp.]